MAGWKMSAGCNDKHAWRQSISEQFHALRRPPRPLRRSLQVILLISILLQVLVNNTVNWVIRGIDPRSTANLFFNAVCIGEKVVNGEESFILKLEADADALESRSESSFDIIRHTVWGYFSQRTGLLMQLEDSHLLRMKAKRGRSCGAQLSSCGATSTANNDVSIFWETSMESVIEDYRYIDNINIAHSGRTVVTLFRYGEGSVNHKRRMEEQWTIEEAGFNFHGLTMDYFLQPSDLKV